MQNTDKMSDKGKKTHCKTKFGTDQISQKHGETIIKEYNGEFSLTVTNATCFANSQSLETNWIVGIMQISR